MSALPPAATVLPASIAPPGPRWPIQSLWQAEAPGRPAIRGGVLPDGLGSSPDGRFEIPLRLDRPTVVANFVSTLDGVVAFDRAGATGGRDISGGFEPDRMFMGLLRATADAVLVGAGTVRASRSRSWTPQSVHPASAEAFAEWRRSLGLGATAPTTIVVSGSGDLDLDRFDDRSGAQVVIVTTAHGAARIGRQAPRDRVEIALVPGDAGVSIAGVIDLLHDRGFGLVLSEAGPRTFGQLLQARVVDELFLTVAPQLAGRSDAVGRLSLVEGVAFTPRLAPWARLRGVMRSADHLFLRYDLSAPGREGVS